MLKPHLNSRKINIHIGVVPQAVQSYVEKPLRKRCNIVHNSIFKIHTFAILFTWMHIVYVGFYILIFLSLSYSSEDNIDCATKADPLYPTWHAHSQTQKNELLTIIVNSVA